MPKYVYRFDEGGREQADLLGGKGANLAEMTRIGLPVPPGFTISTDACRDFMATGRVPAPVRVQVTTALRAVEDAMGRRLGDPSDPLLVSVRSGAKHSMPGMMDTVLNVGLTDATLPGLAAAAHDERFAWDSYRRLIQMFGSTVLGVDAGRFSAALESVKQAAGADSDVDLDADDLRAVVERFRQVVRDDAGRDFPQDPREQLDLAVEAVFGSWDTERARLYRRRERIGHDLGTAVNVVAMVFGNLGQDSGTGVAFTRDPATGAPGAYGDYLPDAQGEDVVAGIRNTLTLEDLAARDPDSHGDLLDAMRRLETHYRDLCDIEFTVEHGRLWLLQTRVGKRTPAAAFRIAVALVDEGLITIDEALGRVSGDQLAQLLFGQFDRSQPHAAVLRGLGASPGAAVGEIVLDNDQATRRAAEGADVVLVRRETTPDDLAGMIAATGVLTARGGRTSHAAVVARGMGTCAVVGADLLDIDLAAGEVRAGDTVLRAGDVIALDGTTGEVFVGPVPVVDSAVARYVAGGLEAGLSAAHDEVTAGLVRAVDRLLTHADAVRRLGVRANADTAQDARLARQRGAEGIGLCRTEHQFLGERRRHLERVILADDDAERTAALEALLPLQRADFVALLEAMDGLPTTIRLLDPPLHEFLPDLTDLSVRVALDAERGRPVHDERLLAAVRRMHETNPMLGLRGVRLGLTTPGLVALQVRAVAEATLELREAGGDPRPEIMVPLIGSARELHLVRTEAQSLLARLAADAGVELDIPLGCMIELPRAALTAARIAGEADFFSFGTNDLTQTTWGFSRDDVEGAFFSDYLDNGVLTISPFETIDADGVGALVRAGVTGGRTTRPDLVCGVCGEHGGDPESIRFFADAGLDYVSCSPFRVPVARLEAGRAAVLGAEAGTDPTT